MAVATTTHSNNRRRGKRARACHMCIVHAAVLLSCSTAWAIGSPEPSHQEKERTVRQTEPISFASVAKSLESDGWSTTYEPPTLDEEVVTARLDAVLLRTLPPRTRLVYSWIVVTGPIEVGNREHVFRLLRPEQQEVRFRLQGGGECEVTVSRQFVKVAPQSKHGEPLAFKREIDRNKKQTIVLLQRKMQVVAQGRTIETWFLPDLAVAVFEKQNK